jgi:acyl-CoA hydrolase
MKKEKKLKPIIRCYLTKNYDINNYIPTTVINTINEYEKNIKPINIATITDEELAERSAKYAKYNKAIILLSKATDKISRKMIRESNRNADLTIEL